MIWQTAVAPLKKKINNLKISTSTIFGEIPFENMVPLQQGHFYLRVCHWCPVHNTLEKFEDATITGHFGFVFKEISGSEITWLSFCHRFRKALFPKRFPCTLNRKTGVFKFFRFEDSRAFSQKRRAVSAYLFSHVFDAMFIFEMERNDFL